jgi:hypothetical protein
MALVKNACVCGGDYATRCASSTVASAYNVAESGLCFRIEGEKNHGTSLHAFMKVLCCSNRRKIVITNLFINFKHCRLCIIAAKESAIHKDNEARGFFYVLKSLGSAAHDECRERCFLSASKSPRAQCV